MRIAMLEIDWQNWIMKLAHDPCSALRGREIRRVFDSRGWPVVSTRYLDPDPGVPRGDVDNPETAFLPGFEPLRRPVITKYSKNIFDVEQTDVVLRELAPDELLITGLHTAHGVSLAAESAVQRGYAVTVVSDACADSSAEEHAQALERIRRSGADVRTTEELIQLLWTAAGRDPSKPIGIAEAAEMTGLSRDTLRWYENEGLIPAVGRNENGYRRYDARTIRGIQLLVRLRRTGMPVAQMRQYIELVEEGETTHRQRLALLEGHREVVRRQMAQLADDLSVLDHKIDGYRQAIRSDT